MKLHSSLPALSAEWRWFFIPLLTVVAAYGVGSRYLFTLDREPITLPMLELSEERERDLVDLQRKLSLSVSNGEPLNVEISSELLNAWLKLSPFDELRLIGEHSWLTIRDGKLVAAISLPLELFGRPGLYFNGDGVFSGSLNDGRVIIEVEELSSRRAHAAGVAFVAKALGGSSLVEKLHLREVVPDELLSRCRASLSGSILLLSCISSQDRKEKVGE